MRDRFEREAHTHDRQSAERCLRVHYYWKKSKHSQKHSFAENARSRFGVVVGLLLLAGAMLAGTSCSSSSPKSANSLTSEQRAALSEVAEAYDNAERSLANSLETTTIVPKFEKWQETEYLHQQALKALRDGLPSGECRSAVEALLVIEEGQNVIRLRLIENYRQEQFGLVAVDTKDYGLSVVNGDLQAEAAVAAACGRSSVDPAASPSNPTRAPLVAELICQSRAEGSTRLCWIERKNPG